MSFQTVLLVLIALMIGAHWYRNYVLPAIAVAIVLWALSEGPKWWKQRRADRAKQRQLDDDAPLRDEFWIKHAAIRKKYDPNNEWNEGTSLPLEYLHEMDALNEQYRAVLDRWHEQ
jgi:hypothetical protein